MGCLYNYAPKLVHGLVSCTLFSSPTSMFNNACKVIMPSWYMIGQVKTKIMGPLCMLGAKLCQVAKSLGLTVRLRCIRIHQSWHGSSSRASLLIIVIPLGLSYIFDTLGWWHGTHARGMGPHSHLDLPCFHILAISWQQLGNTRHMLIYVGPTPIQTQLTGSALISKVYWGIMEHLWPLPPCCGTHTQGNSALLKCQKECWVSFFLGPHETSNQGYGRPNWHLPGCIKMWLLWDSAWNWHNVATMWLCHFGAQYTHMGTCWCSHTHPDSTERCRSHI